MLMASLTMMVNILKAKDDEDKPKINMKPILVGFVSGRAGSTVFATAALTLLKGDIYSLFSFPENIIFLLVTV
jgi:hypothetical protein